MCIPQETQGMHEDARLGNMETMFDARIPFFVHWETQYIGSWKSRLVSGGTGQQNRDFQCFFVSNIERRFK